MAVFSGLCFIPDGKLKWFWGIRFGDLKVFPDENLSNEQLGRIRGLALASLFGAPFIHGLLGFLWQKN